MGSLRAGRDPHRGRAGGTRRKEDDGAGRQPRRAGGVYRYCDQRLPPRQNRFLHRCDPARPRHRTLHRRQPLHHVRPDRARHGRSLHRRVGILECAESAGGDAPRRGHARCGDAGHRRRPERVEGSRDERLSRRVRNRSGHVARRRLDALADRYPRLPQKN